MIVKPKLAGQDDPKEVEYWIDVDSQDDAEVLMKHLKKYKLRKKVQINDLSHIIKSFQIQSINGIAEEQINNEGIMAPAIEGHFFKMLQDGVEMHPSEDFPGELETDVAAFLDPRTSMMGVRVLCAEDSLEIEDPDFLRLNDSSEYDLMRLLMGIGESSREMSNQFPLNMHLHYLNGVSFDKGCYIGQELTQRTYHTGVIRKVALPFLVLSKDDSFKVNAVNFTPLAQVDKSFDLDLKGEQIVSQGKKLGKILTNKFNCGIALVDINKVDKLGANLEYNVSDYRVLLWQPMWLDMQLNREIQEEDDTEEADVI